MGDKSPRSVASARSYVSRSEQSKTKARYNQETESVISKESDLENRSVQSNSSSVASQDSENRSEISQGTGARSARHHTRESRSVASIQSKGRSVVSHQSKGRSVVSHQSKGRSVVSHQSNVSHQSKGRSVVSHQSKGRSVVSHQSTGKSVVSHQSKSMSVASRQSEGQTSAISIQSKAGSAFSSLSQTRKEAPEEPSNHKIENLNLSDLIGCLKGAVLSLEELNRLDLLHEMIALKKRVTSLEEENSTLEGNITSLERERATLQFRLRRLEKRLQENRPMTLLEKLEYGTLEKEEIVSDDDDDDDDDTASSFGPSKELKTLLGTSFRQKWNRRKLAGLNSEDTPIFGGSEEDSVGASTIAARRFVDEYMEDQRREEELQKEREKTISSSTEVEDVALPPLAPQPDVLSI